MAESRLQRGAHVATILAAIATMLALGFGYWTFNQTSEEQTQATALGILQEHIKLAVEHPDLAYRSPSEPYTAGDDKYIWFAAHALFTGETIYSLTAGDTSWDETVGGLIDNHVPFVQSEDFPCGQYDPEFVTFIEARVREDVCP